MNFTSRACLVSALFVAGCHMGFPRADIGYRGNGDAGVVEFMQGNYMSSEAGVAKYLERHLEGGLQPGQVIDQPYLVQRGAMCTDGTPVTCTFKGIANEYFSGLPKENAWRAHRVTRIEARVLFLQPPRIEVIKEESYPGAPRP